ncbi:MAG: glycosyltransferase family 4 protein [Patescibacteria group bacterium]|nr:glycosyltransferase family 4 protein [Patescibacteria group bacterium]
MKLYYIANARMPSERAHGIQLAKMCEAFVESGVDLELVVPDKADAAALPLADFYGLRVPISVKRLPVIRFRPATRLGFNLAACSFALSYFVYLLFQRLRGNGGIVYSIDLDQFSFFLIPLLGMPAFFEMHSTKKDRWPYRFFLRRVAGIVTINERIKESVSRVFGIAPAKIIVHPNGIDAAHFHPALAPEAARARLLISTAKPIVLYTGKFYDWKGLEILPQVARALGDEAVFHLVGDDAREFRAVTGQHPPANMVFWGYRDHKEIPLWLAAGDVLVVLGTKRNTYSFEETSPMKLFEYMAAGRPIVASRTPAIMQVATDEDVLFYEPDDVEDLAAKIRQVLGGPQALRTKIEHAAGKVVQFSWQRRARSITAFMGLCLCGSE